MEFIVVCTVFRYVAWSLRTIDLHICKFRKAQTFRVNLLKNNTVDTI